MSDSSKTTGSIESSYIPVVPFAYVTPVFGFFKDIYNPSYLLNFELTPPNSNFMLLALSEIPGVILIFIVLSV